MPRFDLSASAVRVIPDDAAAEVDWELLYDVHAARLRRIIQRKVGSALVEDVLQETFLRAFKSRHTIDPTRPIAPWLITIALRTAADVHRSQFRSVEAVALDNDESPELALDALEEELLTRARRIGIKHAFASLNTRQRRLLELVAVDGLTYESAAASEAMTTDAVKSVLARARSNFRTSFSAATGEPGVFGAAGVGGWLLRRLRFKARRSVVFVSHHAAGFGAATLTVAVVAAAAIPAVRPVEGRAQEAVGATAALVDLAVASVSPVAEATTAEPSTAGSRGAQTPGGDLAPRTAFQTNVGVQRDGNRVEARSATTLETPFTESRDFIITEVYCENGLVGRTTCKVTDLVIPSS